MPIGPQKDLTNLADGAGSYYGDPDRSQPNEGCYINITWGMADSTADKNRKYSFIIPAYPENITDNQSSLWYPTQIVGRTVPIASYYGVEYRSVSFVFLLHREMFGENDKIEELLINLRATQYPIYGNGILPPTVEIGFGDFYIKGIMRNYNYTWEKPIINSKYQVCSVSISIDEVPDITPDARSILSSLAPLKGNR